MAVIGQLVAGSGGPEDIGRSIQHDHVIGDGHRDCSDGATVVLKGITVRNDQIVFTGNHCISLIPCLDTAAGRNDAVRSSPGIIGIARFRFCSNGCSTCAMDCHCSRGVYRCNRSIAGCISDMGMSPIKGGLDEVPTCIEIIFDAGFAETQMLLFLGGTAEKIKMELLSTVVLFVVKTVL